MGLHDKRSGEGEKGDEGTGKAVIVFLSLPLQPH